MSALFVLKELGLSDGISLISGTTDYADVKAQVEAQGVAMVSEAEWDEAKAVVDLVPPRRKGEFREFMELFTHAEQVAIKTATMQNVEIALWYDKAMGGAVFSLDNPQTAYGVAALVQAKLLTQARADEIMGADFDAP